MKLLDHRKLRFSERERRKTYPEIKRDASVGPWKIESQTSTFEASDEDFDVVVIAELLYNFGSMIKGALAGKVEEAPTLGMTDTTYYLGEKAELYVDDNLDCE